MFPFSSVFCIVITLKVTLPPLVALDKGEWKLVEKNGNLIGMVHRYICINVFLFL